jgi:uncharacterized membrane protein YhaH (DUF805 family)
MGSTMPEAGWYVDPHDPARVRWWDGARWTATSQVPVATPPPPSGPRVRDDDVEGERVIDRPAARRAPSLATTIGMGLRGTLRFGGTTSRREFWQYFAFILVMLAAAIVLIGFSADPTDDVLPFAVLVLMLAGLALVVSLVAMLARRLRDAGRSAWWLLLLISPFASGGLVLLLMAMGRSRNGRPAPRGNA